MSVQFLMRAAGAALVIAGASGCGWWQACQYRRRLKELEQLRQMIFLLKGQILYANAPLSEAFEAVGRRSEGRLARMFTDVAARIEDQQGEPFSEIWSEETERLAGQDGEKEADATALTKEDRQSLAALGKHLGFLDKEAQERTLLLYLEQLEEQTASLREHRQERCRLYTSLGVMGGMFLAILLV